MSETIDRAIVALRSRRAAAGYTVEDEVRAVISALRDVVPVVRDHDGFPAHQLVGAPEDIWRAMIDAALAP